MHLSGFAESFQEINQEMYWFHKMKIIGEPPLLNVRGVRPLMIEVITK
jgi:hypothetical protein